MGTRKPMQQFAGISPRVEADEELRWFFNDAEREADVASLYLSELTGVWDSDEEARERRVRSLKAARTIHRRLQAVLPTQEYVLTCLYTERRWPRALARALGVLAGVVEGSAAVRESHARALAQGHTRTMTVTAWLEQLIVTAGVGAVAAWRKDADENCALAICAYERARRKGPSVVPAGGVP